MKAIFSILYIIGLCLIIMIVDDCYGNMDDNKSTLQNITDYAHKEWIYVDSTFNSKK